MKARAIGLAVWLAAGTPVLGDTIQVREGTGPTSGELRTLERGPAEEVRARWRFRLRLVEPSGGAKAAGVDALVRGVAGARNIQFAAVEEDRHEAVILTTAGMHSRQAAAELLSSWRRDPSVLWVEASPEGKSMPLKPVEFPSGTAQFVIVRPKEAGIRALSARSEAPSADYAALISEAAGVSLRYHSAASAGTHVYRLPEGIRYEDAWEIVSRLDGSGVVEFADLDMPVRAQATPNDPMFGQQWHLGTTGSSNLGGTNLPATWDITLGSPNVVVAVVDTGIATGHPDFAGKLVAGYDFVSDPANSGDGDGRDADPTDPGAACNGRAAGFHGTHVAGTVGAATSNGIGVAGVAPNVMVQPLRALNICGSGTTLDIADAIAWAAGASVPGAPANTTPARVINLSLSGESPCPSIYQQVINDAIARGVVVVAAAGNQDGIDVSRRTPANCAGVVRVAAHTRFGDYASYTNKGTSITISGPGGQTSSAPPNGSDGGVISTIGNGAYGAKPGTSMAAPHVSGVVALVRTRFPNYTPNNVAGVLFSSARQFPYSSNCFAAGNCGPGMLDGQSAVTDSVIIRIGIEGSGSITSSPSGISCTQTCGYLVPYSVGQVTLTATPSPGYTFRGWIGDWPGACTGTSTCTISIAYAKTVFAVFSLSTSSSTVSVSKSGTGSGVITSSPFGINCGNACTAQFAVGATVTLSASPSTGSEFGGWTGACAGAGPNCTVTASNSFVSTANFRVLDDYPDTASAAVGIGVNSSIPGTLNFATDADWFRIDLPSSGTWTIRSSGATDTMVEVFGPDGVTSYGADDDSGEGLNFQIVFSVPSAQRVLVRVTGYSDLNTTSIGPYTLISSFTAGQASTASYTGLWWNPAESGWGLNTNHQGDTVFATLFTYAPDGIGMWLVASGLARQADGSYSGPLYRTTGPPYFTVPWTSISVTQVGSMTLRFASATSATLSYTFNGTTVNKSIQRQVYGSPVPECTMGTGTRSGEINYQDLWWNPNESGWGVNITHQGNTLFATLFTYTNSGRDGWLVASGLARQADGSYSGPLYLTSGPPFNAQPWSSIAVSEVGTMSFRFTSGNSGTLTYSVLGTTVVKSIQRQVFGNTVPVCR